MHSKIIFVFFFYFIINFSTYAGHWTCDSRSSVHFSVENISKIMTNETDFLQSLLEDNKNSTTDNGILFWEIPDKNETEIATSGTEMDIPENLKNWNDNVESSENDVEINTNDSISLTMNPSELVVAPQPNEESKANKTLIHDEMGMSLFLLNEKITLQRNNCNLEIAVTDTHNLKIEITLEKLGNNTSGKCCITLKGRENSRLGVLISNIHLYQNESEGEVLKVITADYGSDFVLKEYNSWTKYYPLLLTEAHKVYLKLQFKVTNISPNEQESHFNLEAFNYHKYDNNI